MTLPWFVLLIQSLLFIKICHAKIGPPYPVTASWFADRFTKTEWDTALDEFRKIGGDTVLLRGMTLSVRSKEDIMRDPTFVGCTVPSRKRGGAHVHCVQDAEEELTSDGVIIAGFATYEYEENFSDRIMHCPQKYDRKIESSRIYYRLVVADLGFDCQYTANETFVTVVLTSFAGIDPHELLVQSAAERNMSVYLGMPESVDLSLVETDHDRKVWLYEGYFYFLFYVLDEHNHRFGNIYQAHALRTTRTSLVPSKPVRSRERVRSYCDGMRSQQFRKALRKLDFDKFHGFRKISSLSRTAVRDAGAKSFAGYYIRREVDLTRFVVSDSSKDVLGLPEVCFFFQIDETILYVNENRSYAVSAKINMQKQFKNSTIKQHVEGLKSFFTNAASVYQGSSVLILHEGRGMGLAAHYWPSEENYSIARNDPVLYQILRSSGKPVDVTTTYSQVYSASTLQLFPELMIAFRNVTAGNPGFPNSTARLWVMVEAYENLRDNPCLPIDTRGSGMDLLLQRTTKERTDSSLSAIGAFPNKVAAFAWDFNFFCLDNQSQSLLSAIMADAYRPIITSCGFHSPKNLSLVVTGFNIDGPDPFVVTYQDKDNTTQTERIPGYYYELDYGIRHNRVTSLMYIMLRDMQGLATLKESGYINVYKEMSYKKCKFAYSL